MRDVPIGRLALRTEGGYWKAYYALHDTLDGAVPLGSIATAAVAGNGHRKVAFLQLMQATVADIIEEATGRRPVWPGDPHPLLEAEGAELGHSAVRVDPPAAADRTPAMPAPPSGNTRRLLGRGWDNYARTLPADAPPVQVRETRRAFYAGANACLAGFFGGLSAGEDITAEDEAMLAGIDDELADFEALVRLGLA